jgi:diguanylate cyclase (GGDEF)-like protein
MTELALDPPTAAQPDQPVSDLIRGALQESRQRWRHLVSFAADIAFETDAMGRFVFILPETPLGWPAATLIGQPSELLVGDDGCSPRFNPFRPGIEIRRRRSWVRSYDGTPAMIAFSAVPLFDGTGAIRGARGIGIDMTAYDAQSSLIASRLRRGEVLDHVLSRVGQETQSDRMMDVALWTMVHALGAEGAAIAAALSEGGPIDVVHECGPGAGAIRDAAASLIAEQSAEPRCTTNLEGRLLLVVRCPSRFGANAGLAIWRAPHARPWDNEDTMLAVSATGVIRMILDYEAMHQEMALQARTDPLTGLLNRRAFLEETTRYAARLDREGLPGTLLYLDVDAFKAVNDRSGHAMGDAVLTCLSDLLRKLVRPSDLIARPGGDEFAVWLGGADHMTAAERADHLCRTAPAAFRAVLEQDVKGLGLSIGIATRRSGSAERVRDLMRRADLAMYDVKRSGGGHWRVSLLDSDA